MAQDNGERMIWFVAGAALGVLAALVLGACASKQVRPSTAPPTPSASSPSVTTFDQSRTGSTSRHRQTPRVGLRTSRSLKVLAARSRSMAASCRALVIGLDAWAVDEPA